VWVSQFNSQRTVVFSLFPSGWGIKQLSPERLLLFPFYKERKWKGKLFIALVSNRASTSVWCQGWGALLSTVLSITKCAVSDRDCFGVLDCEWCVVDSDGKTHLDKSYCAPQKECFGGIVGAKSPYVDDMGAIGMCIGNPEPFNSWIQLSCLKTGKGILKQ
jgi:hypothetical protein